MSSSSLLLISHDAVLESLYRMSFCLISFIDFMLCTLHCFRNEIYYFQILTTTVIMCVTSNVMTYMI